MLVGKFEHLGIAEGGWPPLGRTEGWDRQDWPMVLHFYNYGGWQMTPEEARAYARSAGAFDGTVCASCQSSQGAGLSQYSRLMKELFQL